MFCYVMQYGCETRFFHVPAEALRQQPGRPLAAERMLIPVSVQPRQDPPSAFRRYTT